MTKQQIVKTTAAYIKRQFEQDNTGHDWWHIHRAWKMATRIARVEKADRFIVEMAILLHDLGDYKLEPDRKDRVKEKVGAWLKKMNVDKPDSDEILYIVTNMSFSKNVVTRQKLSLAGQIVQDADRLDAIGAMGIMRNFVYDAAHNIPIYIPGLKPRAFKSNEDYQKRGSIGIQHFYEKLLKLKDQMNTKTAKKIASGRHAYMVKFLDQFFAEWEGKR